MKMNEICIERAANGYIIECKYEGAARALGESPMGRRSVEHVAVNEKDLMMQVKMLIGKLTSEDESSSEADS